MNRFEKLLATLNAKMNSIREICEDLIELTGADKAFEELVTVVAILRDPQGAIDKRNSGYIAANAEVMIEMLCRYERRFLVSITTINGLKARIVGLHPEAYKVRAKEIWRAIDGYDTLRVNHNASTAGIRSAYLTVHDLIAKVEAITKQIASDEINERIRGTTTNSVVGSIKPARRNKAKARAKSAEHRKFVEESNKVGKKKSA